MDEGMGKTEAEIPIRKLLQAVEGKHSEPLFRKAKYNSNLSFHLNEGISVSL